MTDGNIWVPYDEEPGDDLYMPGGPLCTQARLTERLLVS